MMLGSLFAHNEPPASLETTRRKEIQPNEENVLRVTKGGSASIDLLVVVFFFFCSATFTLFGCRQKSPDYLTRICRTTHILLEKSPIIQVAVF